jgi:hypothetical protein
MHMNSIEGLLARTLALTTAVAALTVTGSAVTMGTASAADHVAADAATNAQMRSAHAGDGGAISVGGDATGKNTDRDSRTAAHSSGPGGTAVNSAGDAAADQTANQSRSDTSTHSRTENNSRTDSHDSTNSHNTSRYRDSHDSRERH